MQITKAEGHEMPRAFEHAVTVFVGSPAVIPNPGSQGCAFVCVRRPHDCHNFPMEGPQFVQVQAEDATTQTIQLEDQGETFLKIEFGTDSRVSISLASASHWGNRFCIMYSTETRDDCGPCNLTRERSRAVARTGLSPVTEVSISREQYVVLPTDQCKSIMMSPEEGQDSPFAVSIGTSHIQDLYYLLPGVSYFEINTGKFGKVSRLDPVAIKIASLEPAKLLVMYT